MVELNREYNLRLTACFPHHASVHSRQICTLHPVVSVSGVVVLALLWWRKNEAFPFKRLVQVLVADYLRRVASP